MTSSNEPGAPDKGERPNGDGSVERAGVRRGAAAQVGRNPDTGDSPPWQRGAARAARPTRGQPEAPGETTPTGQRAGADGLNRYLFGTAVSGASGTPPVRNAPAQDHDAAPPRTDRPSPERAPSGDRPSETYSSELPDLSGPVPGPSQRRAAPSRASETTAPSGSWRSAFAEGRESRANRVQVSRRRGPVRASMQIRRIDPWSTLKVSLVLSVALFLVWMITVALLYLVLGIMGVWSKLNSNVGDLLNNNGTATGELVSPGAIFGGAVLIGLVNVVLLTAMATIAAFIYNATTDLIGGVEVTLADRD